MNENKIVSANREVFNKIVRDALSDGIITSEESKLIYDSGKAIGLEQNEIEAFLNDLKKTVGFNIKQSTGTKTPELIHSRRLIEKKKLPDGRIQELWEHIDEELRSNNRPDARPGTMLKIRTTKKIKKIYKDQGQSSISTLTPYIKNITDINYTQVKKTMVALSVVAPFVNNAIPLIDCLEKISDNYKKSKSPDRDTDFLIEIGKTSLITSLPIIEKYVPYGNVIGTSIRFIMSY